MSNNKDESEKLKQLALGSTVIACLALGLYFIASAVNKTDSLSPTQIQDLQPQARPRLQPPPALKPAEQPISTEQVVEKNSEATKYCQFIFRSNNKVPTLADLGIQVDQESIEPVDPFGKLERKNGARIQLLKQDGTDLLNGNYDYVDYPQKEPCKWILCCRKLDGGYFFIDRSGKKMSPEHFEQAHSFSNGYAAVKSEKWGYIDEKGELKLPFKYQVAKDFSEGLAPVGINGRWAFIDKTGKMVIPPVFHDACSFENGYARVYFNGLWGAIPRQKLPK